MIWGIVLATWGGEEGESWVWNSCIMHACWHLPCGTYLKVTFFVVHSDLSVPLF